MCLSPDFTGHPEISRRSGDFSAEGAEGRKVSFSLWSVAEEAESSEYKKCTAFFGGAFSL